MEGKLNYLVVVTPEAEKYYLELLFYLYQTHSEESAHKKSSKILALSMSLSHQPYRGRLVDDLKYLGKNHRFVVYQITKRKAVKIIYFIDTEGKKVFVTDFFPTQMDPIKITIRS